MDVLVTGGTGFVGTHLSRELDSRGHDVTALSRSADGGDLPEGVDVAVGDVTDPETLAEPMADQDVVVNLVALAPLFQPKGGDVMHERVHLDGTRNVVEAATSAGVPTIVQMSALGADPDGETAYIRAKGRAEQVVWESDLDWTIFRPSVIFGDGGEFVRFTRALTTPYLTALPGGGRTRFQPIWIGDLAPMLAAAIEDDSHRGQTYDIGGPEPVTLAAVARMTYRAEGKPLWIVPIPMALTAIGMRLVDPLPFVPFGADQARSLRFDNTVLTNDVEAFGRTESDLLGLPEYLSAD
ncbi:MAG: complex I NDUFA9 subunit family protein [Halodesulfurarchaeum sp.]